MSTTHFNKLKIKEQKMWASGEFNKFKSLISINQNFNIDSSLNAEEKAMLDIINKKKRMSRDERKQNEFEKIKTWILSFYSTFYIETKKNHPKLSQIVVKAIAKERAINEYSLWLLANPDKKSELEAFLESEIINHSDSE